MTRCGTRRVSARDRCIEKAGDTDSARQPTIDSGLDEPWREESQRYRHAHVALAAGLPCGGGQRPQMWWSSRYPIRGIAP
jgi:hypothetical protein